MLRIYICSQCGSTRIVSNNHDSSCFMCNQSMHKAPISYEEYVRLNSEERETFIAYWLKEVKSKQN